MSFSRNGKSINRNWPSQQQQEVFFSLEHTSPHEIHRAIIAHWENHQEKNRWMMEGHPPHQDGRDPLCQARSEFLPQTTALEVQYPPPLPRENPPLHPPKPNIKNHLPHQAGRPVPRHHAAGYVASECGVYTASTYLNPGNRRPIGFSRWDGKGLRWCSFFVCSICSDCLGFGVRHPHTHPGAAAAGVMEPGSWDRIGVSTSCLCRCGGR